LENNILVPKHEILSPEEAERVLAFYKVTLNELPKIKKDDPALAKLNAKIGDIIRITHGGLTADKSFYYRVVI